MNLRPLKRTEVDAVADLWNNAVAAEGDGYAKHRLTAGELTSFLDSEYAYRPSTLVATRQSDPVGVAIAYPEREDDVGHLAGIAVAPTEQRTGIGGQLLRACETALADASVGSIRWHINRQPVKFSHVYLDTGPDQFLKAHGYRSQAHAVRLRNELDPFSVPASVQRRRRELAAEGISLGTVSHGDRSHLLTFMRRYFPGGWTSSVRRATRAPDPADVLVARDGGRIIGFHGPHEVDDETGRGRFGMPGVAPPYRGRGIGKTMIYLGLEHLSELGATYTDYRTGYQRPDVSASTEIYWETGARLVEVMWKRAIKRL